MSEGTSSFRELQDNVGAPAHFWSDLERGFSPSVKNFRLLENQESNASASARGYSLRKPSSLSLLKTGIRVNTISVRSWKPKESC